MIKPFTGKRLYTMLAFMGVTASAHAADPVTDLHQPAVQSQPVEADRWHYAITPYIWGTGLSGEISPFRQAPSVHINESFSDVLQNLNLAGFLNIEANNGTYGFYADMMYVDISQNGGTGPVTIPGVGTVPGVDIGVESKLFAGALFGSYKLVKNDRFTLDALAGARAFRVWTKVSAKIPSYNLSTEAKSDFGWIDPAVGFGFKYQVSDRFKLVGQADIGGFSVGSDLTWQALAAVKYDITRSSALSFGYKYMSVDYDNDGHVFDTEFQGPMLGITFRF